MFTPVPPNREQVSNGTFAVLGSALLLAGYLFWSFRAVTEGGFRVVNRHLERMRDGDLTRPIAAWDRTRPRS